MRSPVNRSCAAWLLLGLACFLPTRAVSEQIIEPIPPDAAPEPAAPEPKKDETERWVPAFSVYSGVLVQKADATLRSSALQGACEPPPLVADPLHCERQVRPTAFIEDPPEGEPYPPVELVTIPGDDLMVTPFVVGSLELMTPGLTSVPGRPRLFVHGDAGGSFAFTRNVAKEGVPGDFELLGDFRPTEVVTESNIGGQGSATTAEVKPLLLSAGAGVAFTLEPWERRLRIKPSVEYLREEIEVTGVVRRAVAIVDNPRAGEFPDGFRLIELSGGEKRAFHGIGPGLEVEMDTLRAGPFMLSVYVASQAYAFLGDLEVAFSDTNEDGETANWSFEKKRWGFRAGVGLRFRWLPE
jgi:hypothetical protein